MASLRELQYSFAAALRDPAVACPVRPAANLDVYRHNGEALWAGVLAISFPVVKRRVGDDYFRQLAHHYRRAHRSRSGDLQWLGEAFPAFLDAQLRDGDYAWLADLARLEWLVEMAAIREVCAPLAVDALAGYSPEALEHLRLALQPSLRLLGSRWPVFSVWEANQASNAPPVDQSVGAEQGLVFQRNDGVVVRRVEPDLFRYLSALAAGESLGTAMTTATLDEASLLPALRFLFTEGLVCGLTAPG